MKVQAEISLCTEHLETLEPHIYTIGFPKRDGICCFLLKDGMPCGAMTRNQIWLTLALPGSQQRAAASVKSKAKSEAARLNGLKGGRPKKQQLTSHQKE